MARRIILHLPLSRTIEDMAGMSQLTFSPPKSMMKVSDFTFWVSIPIFSLHDNTAVQRTPS